MAISHVFTNPVPDGTITSIVRPSDWNSAHNQYYTLSGNVLGASTVSGTNVIFQAGANVSLSGTGGTIVIQGTNTPQPTSYVSNVNGLSGAVSLAVGSSLSSSANGSSITFGLASNITTALQSANSNYLTTQTVQTQASGNIAGSGFTSTTTAGTAVVGTQNSNGLSLGVPAYLTTARASTDAVGLNTAQTNVTWTVNSGGISLNAAGYAGTNLSTANVSATLNSSGLTLSAPAVSALSNGNNITISNTGTNVGISAQAVAAAAGTQTATSGTVNFANSNGITFGMSGSNQITASYTVPVVSSLAGTGFTTATTTGTNVVGTLSTNGLSLGVPAYVTNAVGGGGVAIAGGTQTATSGTVNFANSNGITFGMSGSNQITASYTVPTVPTSYVSNVNGSSGQISLNVGSSLSSSTAGSSITFGLASDITTALQSANANYLTTQTNPAFSASGGSSTFQTLSFTNSNGVTFSNTNGSIRITHALQYTSNTSAITASALNTSASRVINIVAATDNTGGGTASLSSNVSFSNANGMTFYTSAGGAVVASYTVPTQSVQTQASGNIAGTGFTSTTTAGTNVVGTLSTNGLSLGVPAYLTAAAGGNFSGGVSNLGNTAGSTGITGTRIIFVGTNNISLSQSTDANGATISINQTGAAGAMYANLSGATSGNTTASGNTLNFSGINVTLSGANNSQIAISAPATSSLSAGNNISLSSNGSTIGLSAQAVAAAAGTQTAASGTVNFANSNGITFGMSGSNQITASYTVPATTGFAGTGFTSTTTAGTAVVGTLSTNGLSLGVPAYLTAAAGGNFSGGVSNLGNTAGSTGITGTRIVFVGTNNISLSQSTDANGATISINQTGGGGGAMYANLSGATSGNTTASGSTINLSGINVTLSGTNNSQIAISAPATSSLSAGNNISISTNGSTIIVSARAVALSAGTQTATSGTVNFANSNGITFGMSGSNQITASYTVPPSFSAGISNLGNTAGSTGISGTRIVFVGTNNISLSQSTDANGATISINQTGGGGGGLTNINLSAGTTSNNLSNIVFNDANNVSFGLNGSTVTASIATSLTNVNVSAGTTSNNLSNIVFSNTNGVSFGLNGSTVTASVAPAGGGFTASGYNHYNDVVQALTTHGNGTVVIDHLDLDANIQFDRFGLLIGNSNATNSSGSHTVSFWLGVYTQNGSSISQLFSTSSSLAATMSGTVGSYSLYSGVRQFTIPFTTTITAGEYFLAVLSRTSSAGANGSYSQVAQSNIASNYNGLWGASAAATGQQFAGMGYYSTTTTAMPQSIAFSQIQGTNSNALRPPVVIFHSGTY